MNGVSARHIRGRLNTSDPLNFRLFVYTHT